MKDKIISFVIWLILWGIIVYGYTYYTKPKMWGPGMWGTPPTMNVENMSDEQLERMLNEAFANGKAYSAREQANHASEPARQLTPTKPSKPWLSTISA